MEIIIAGIQANKKENNGSEEETATEYISLIEEKEQYAATKEEQVAIFVKLF